MTDSVTGINLHYKIEGEGEPLVFLHGFLEDHSMWDTIVPHFTEDGYQTICIDLPCHGQSRFSDEACSTAQMAADVHELLNRIAVDNPAVVGHSLGGYVGLELLRLRPLKLTLLHSNFWEDPESKKRDRDRVIKIVRKAKDIFIDEAIPHLFHETNREKCAADIERLKRKAKEIPVNEIVASSFGLRDRKSQYDLFENNRIHIIHGVEDPILPMNLLETQLDFINGRADVYLIDKCGHMSMWEAPDQLVLHLKQILGTSA